MQQQQPHSGPEKETDRSGKPGRSGRPGRPEKTNPSDKKRQPVRFGVDVVVEDLSNGPDILRSGSWGMVTNDAARCSEDAAMTSRKALRDAGIPVTQLFSPEHGISRYGADGKAMDDDSDPVTGLPVCSLYGKTMRPPDEMLSRLDGVIFDIPDIGSRFYTYIWTLSHVMEACAEAGKPLVVLDRPNPVSGDLAASEGPVLDVARCASFLGRAAIPVRHSLTAGEFALWLKDHWKLDVTVLLVPAEGWNRSMHWPDTGLPFVPTSPAMPYYESALCYPGSCLFEATNLSTGRGTDIPFQQVGAPWLLTLQLRPDNNDFLRQIDLPGVGFREVTFVPDDDPWKGQTCRGIRWEVTDRRTFRPVRTGLVLLTAIRHAQPEAFEWKTYPTAANPTGEGHFERLIGATDIRPALEGVAADFLRTLPGRLDTSVWQKEIADYWCYD